MRIVNGNRDERSVCENKECVVSIQKLDKLAHTFKEFNIRLSD